MANRYYVGDGLPWWNFGSWSTTSGGASGASIPTGSDDVFFDANSFSADNKVVSVVDTNIPPIACNNLDLSAITHTCNLQLNNPTNHWLIYGSFIGSSLATISNVNGTFLEFHAYNGVAGQTVNINSNGTILDVPVFFKGESSSIFSLQSNLVIIGNASILGNNILSFSPNANCTFNTNNFNITTAYLEFDMSTSSQTINWGSSTITLKPTTSLINSFITNSFGTSPTVNVGTSKFVIDLSSFPDATAIFRNTYNNFTLNNFTINTNGINKTVYFQTKNLIINGFSVVNPPVTLEFSSGWRYTFSNLTLNGSHGKLITLISDNPGSQFQFNVTNSNVSFVRVSDSNASFGNTIFDTLGGVDSGNNINWFFGNAASEFLQTIQMVGADLGDVQAINAGKDDDGTPLYYELETQELEFGNRAKQDNISDQLTVVTQNGQDSQLQARENDDDYKDIPIDMNKRVAIGKDINLEGNYFTFRWFGQAQNSSPILEEIYIENINEEDLSDG